MGCHRNRRLAGFGLWAFLAMAVVACGGPEVVVIEEPPGAVRVDRSMVIGLSVRVISSEPDTVELTGTITNAGGDSLYMEGGSLSLQAYRGGERPDRPAWDSRLRVRHDPRLGRPPPVFGPLSVIELEAGDSIVGQVFRIRFTADELLGDSLPPDTYRLGAVLEFERKRRRYDPDPTPTVVYLPAGSLRLRR